MKNFAFVDILVFITYIFMVLFVGLAFNKKNINGKEYFKGDGMIPWWVTSVSIFTTLLSPISFLSLAGNSYSGTWLLWFAQLGIFIAIPLTIKIFLPIYSKLNIDTAYDYLEIRYKDKGLRVIGAIIFIIYQIGRLSIIMYLPSIVLSKLTTININLLIIIMGVTAVVYTFFGGLKSVVWTDFVQGVVLVLGVIISLMFLLTNIDGGIKEVFRELIYNNKFLSVQDITISKGFLKSGIFIMIIGAGLNTFSAYISSQDIVQRFTTTTDLKQLKKMIYGNAILSLSVTTIFYLIGTSLFVFYNQNKELISYSSQDQVFATYIINELPIGVSGLLLAAIYAAAQSTLSTGLNSIATSWTLDIQSSITKEMDSNQQTKLARFISAIVGGISILIAMILSSSELKSAYEWFNSFMGLVLGVLAGVFILGALNKNANKYDAYISLLVTIISVIIFKFSNMKISIWLYSLISIIVSLVTGYLSVLFRNKYKLKMIKAK